ncbi:hypothetical protein [Spiroplasma sp. DGKH1]|uniref:hypothetical protein n=1 Tax=Spiroplasma sp. DGKH1 TaxID=3050074 RepID=UPI0034C64FD8
MKKQQDRNVFKKCLKEYHSYLKQYKKVNPLNLSLFIIDCLIFAIIMVGFIFQLANHKTNNPLNIIFSYVVLTLSFYILIKFTIANFFYTNIYFIKIVVYEKSLLLKNIKIEKKEVINWVPFWFLNLLILINVISTIVINYQAVEIFKDSSIISACISTLANILLIPSFGTILNKITEIRKPILNNYINLIKVQFVGFQDLFKTYQAAENFEYISFENISITSKKGIFVLNNLKSDAARITKFNESIVEIYHEIWKKYVDFLKVTRHPNNKRVQKKVYFIERVFDQIFINFLEL